MSIFKPLLKKIKENIQIQTTKARGQALLLLNVVLIVFQFVYLWLRIGYVNEQVPFWFTKLWGDQMLAPKELLYLLPTSAALILVASLLLEFSFRKLFVRFLKETLLTFVTISNLLLAYSLLKIMYSASVPFPALINPLFLSLLIPFVVAYFAAMVFLPWFIQFANDNDIVTNPKVHQHPGMILQQASARGGGALYTVLFLLISIMFVGVPAKLVGFLIAVLMLGVLGFTDDYQNTHPKSAFRALENPALRLVLMFCAVAVLVLSGVVIKVVGNPFAGIFDLGAFNFGNFALPLSVLTYVFTALWIVWVLNLLSWSNGIDGQYSGIIGIASLFICILALRFSPLLPIHKQVAIMAAISAGISFGFAKYTWYPSAILWGFGATSAGLVISALSILINTKILLSVLILLIPFLDASVIFARRILQHKSPLHGDRQHFHQLLLEYGWSVPKIARFYWLTTFIFGVIGLFSSERYLIQTVMIVGGIVAFVIVLMNLRALKNKQ